MTACILILPSNIAIPWLTNMPIVNHIHRLIYVYIGDNEIPLYLVTKFIQYTRIEYIDISQSVWGHRRLKREWATSLRSTRELRWPRFRLQLRTQRRLEQLAGGPHWTQLLAGAWGATLTRSARGRHSTFDHYCNLHLFEVREMPRGMEPCLAW